MKNSENKARYVLFCSRGGKDKTNLYSDQKHELMQAAALKISLGYSCLILDTKTKEQTSINLYSKNNKI